MAQIDLGKLKFNWKGAWATNTAYEVDDVVSYGGASFVVTVAVPSNNGTHPKANSSFSYMSTGFEMKGAWQSGVTYYRGEIVSYQNAFYVVIVDNNDSVKTNSPVSQVAASTPTMAIFNNADSADVLTTSGDLLIRDNDGVTNKRLACGVVGARLTAVDTPNEDLPNENNFIYNTVQSTSTFKATLLNGDDFPDAETQTFVVTVAAVSGQNQFHIGGVERPTIDLRVNSVYTFDVSDASNAGHVLEFGVQRPGLTGTIPLSTQSASGVTRNGTPGQSGATVVVQLPAYGRLVINYYCSAHSAMANGTVSHTLAGPTTYSNTMAQGPAARKLSRGKSYTFNFPCKRINVFNQRSFCFWYILLLVQTEGY